jgi:hypothetical protein
MIAQHNCTLSVSVTGGSGIYSVYVPLVVGLLVLTQCEHMLTPFDGTFWACISVMMTSRGFGPSKFLF